MIIRLRILVILIGMMRLMDCERMKSAVVQFNKISSHFNPTNLEFCNFFITPGSSGQSFELNSNLLRNISNDLHVCVDFLMKNMAEDSYKQIFSYDFDMCRLWQGLMRQTIARTWLKNLKKFSNFPTTCPVQRGYYFIRRMKIDTRSVPMFIIRGQYMVNVLIYIKRSSFKELLVNSSMEVEVIKA